MEEKPGLESKLLGQKLISLSNGREGWPGSCGVRHGQIRSNSGPNSGTSKEKNNVYDKKDWVLRTTEEYPGLPLPLILL